MKAPVYVPVYRYKAVQYNVRAVRFRLLGQRMLESQWTLIIWQIEFFKSLTLKGLPSWEESPLPKPDLLLS
ncbi:hypothetical protein D3C71_2098280 [compost metagenome]